MTIKPAPENLLNLRTPHLRRIPGGEICVTQLLGFLHPDFRATDAQPARTILQVTDPPADSD